MREGLVRGLVWESMTWIGALHGGGCMEMKMAAWVWGMLVAVLAGCGSSQVLPGSGFECEVLTRNVVQGEIVVDAFMLQDAENDLQNILECLPANSIVKLNMEEVPLPITIRKPVTIKSFLDFTKLNCYDEASNDAFFAIRSDNVTVSKLRVESCRRASHWGVIDIGDSQNIVLEDVQCVHNDNSVGPSCISGWGSKVTLKKLKAQNNWGGEGGVLLLSYSDVALENGVFQDNEANFTGGVGHFESCNLAINSTIIEGNRASDGGGALNFLGGQKVSIIGSVFIDNFSKGAGGAIVFLQSINLPFNKVDVHIQNTAFDGNSGYFGGAIFFELSLNLFINNSTFIRNNAVSNGGALSVQAMTKSENKVPAFVYIAKSRFRNNKVGANTRFGIRDSSVLSSSKVGGGAISLQGRPSQLICTYTIFSSNSAAAGGAILLEDVDSLDLIESNFTNHKAILGGAIAVLNTNLKMGALNVLFTRNKASQGGAIFLEWLNRIGIEDAQNRKRILSSTVFPDSVIKFHKVDFLRNKAALGGGALNLAGLMLSCSQCKFVSNSAVSRDQGEGGGILMTAGAAVVLNGTEMSSCNAATGGALAVRGGILLAKKSLWTENFAETGGAISGEYTTSFALGSEASLELFECQFSNNNVGRAGIVHLVQGNSSVTKLLTENDSEEEDMYLSMLTVSKEQGNYQDYEGYSPPIVLYKTDFNEPSLSNRTPVVLVPDIYYLKVCCSNNRCETGENLTSTPCYNSNDIIAGKSSPRTIGTSAKALLVEYESRVNEKISSGESMPPIRAVLQDVFGKEAPQEGTLTVAADNDTVHLSGAPVTGIFISGTSIMKGMTMTAKPGTYNLTVKFKSSSIGDQILEQKLTAVVRECTFGEASKVNGTFCEKCRPQSYNFIIHGVECEKCPTQGAYCPGPTITPTEGWWNSGSHSPSMRTCLVEDACKFENRTEILAEAALEAGEEEILWNDPRYNQCTEEYEGVLCGSCSPNYGRSSSATCEKCLKWTVIAPRLGFSLLQLLITALLFIKGANDYAREVLERGALHQLQELNVENFSEDIHETLTQRDLQRRRRKKTILDPTDILKILVNYLQVTATAVAINMQDKQAVEGVLNGLDSISGVTTTSGYFATSCTLSGPNRFVHAIYVTASMPVAMWMCISAYGVVQYMKKKKSSMALVTHCFVAAMAVMDLSYIGLTNTAAKIFSFVSMEVKGKSTPYLWVEDTNIDYFGMPHLLLMGLVGLPLGVFVTLGFPIFVFLIIERVKNQLHEENVVSRLGIFFQPYRTKCIHWEGLIYFRKAAVAILTISSFAVKPVLLSFFFLGTLVVCLALQVQYQPYKESRLNKMEEASIFVSITVYILGGIIQCFYGDKRTQLGLSVAMVASQMAFVVYMIYQWAVTYFKFIQNWVRSQPEYENHTGGFTSICHVMMRICMARMESMAEKARAKFSNTAHNAPKVDAQESSNRSNISQDEAGSPSTSVKNLPLPLQESMEYYVTGQHSVK